MILSYLLSKANSLSGGSLGVAALVIIGLLIALPFALIWGINVLGDLQNPYDFKHWVAALAVMLLFGSTGHKSKGNSE